MAAAARKLSLGVIGVTGAIALGAVAVAIAQDLPRRRVLHEDLPAPAADDLSPTIGDAPREGKNPAALSAGDKVLPEPSTDRKNDSPVLGRGGFAADRDTETRPDLNTGPDGTLKYVSVFNPDVLPFKRMTSLDAVRDDYTLYVRSQAQVDVPVGGRADDKTRDRFWGDVMIELEPGRDVPLPSVAPDMRILSYETTPAVPLQFSKDGADNFFVRSDEPSARGTYRLVFLVDADAGYFAPSMPAKMYTIRDVRRLAQQEGLLPTLPATVQREAERSIAHLDIDDRQPLAIAFNKLVYYHREFEAQSLVDTSGNIYRDLFDEQAGVCRHRSFTFIVTALALGIPTRYITNEAHAFVEVWFPDRGWQRVDLGGAALRMEVSGADDKTLHRPRAEDPFAKPDSYENNYTQLEGDIRGLSQDQIDDRRASPADGAASGDFDPLVDNAATGDDNGTVTDDAVGPGDVDPARPPDPRKRTPTVTIADASTEGYRGEAIEVRGRVFDDATPMSDVRVDVFVAPLGQAGNDFRLIGRGATDRNGEFVVEADVPADLDLRVYEIFVTTPESATHNPGRSD